MKPTLLLDRLACPFIQTEHRVLGVRQHQRIGAGAPISSPRTNQLRHGIVTMAPDMDVSVIGIGFKRRATITATECEGRVPHPCFALTAHLRQLDKPGVIRNGAKRSAGLNRLKLPRIPDKNKLGLGRVDRINQHRHVAR